MRTFYSIILQISKNFVKKKKENKKKTVWKKRINFSQMGFIKKIEKKKTNYL